MIVGFGLWICSLFYCNVFLFFAVCFCVSGVWLSVFWLFYLVLVSQWEGVNFCVYRIKKNPSIWVSGFYISCVERPSG